MTVGSADVAKHNLRRRDLLHREFWQSSLGCGQRIMISPAATTSDHFLRSSKYV